MRGKHRGEITLADRGRQTSNMGGREETGKNTEETLTRHKRAWKS